MHEPRLATAASTATLLLSVARAAVRDSALEPDALRLEPDGWETLAGEAESTRLAPLVHASLDPHRHAVPELTMRQLEALVLRHRVWHRERTAAVTEILQALSRISISALVLKGSALAWMIYDSPTLRPMSDVDLLVPGADARRAQAALVALGFQAERTSRRFGSNAHHLPIAGRSRSGLPISVEIHVNAITRDTLTSISMSNLSEPPRSFALNGTPARTLGHLDTLRQLVHHLLEPSWDGRLRLIGVVDLLRYASIFHPEIDWRRLKAEYPFVLNALACLHYVIPLPTALEGYAPVPTASIPRGVGQVIHPLRSVLARRRPTVMFRELLNPSDWWLHAYYGVPVERSLTGVRLVRHPWRVARWLGLRAAGF